MAADRVQVKEEMVARHQTHMPEPVLRAVTTAVRSRISIEYYSCFDVDEPSLDSMEP